MLCGRLLLLVPLVLGAARDGRVTGPPGGWEGVAGPRCKAGSTGARADTASQQRSRPAAFEGGRDGGSWVHWASGEGRAEGLGRWCPVGSAGAREDLVVQQRSRPVAFGGAGNGEQRVLLVSWEGRAERPGPGWWHPAGSTGAREGSVAQQRSPTAAFEGGSGRGKRSISKARHVELLVVADAMLSRALGSDLSRYILALFSAADRLYRHPSLASDVRLVVTRILSIQEGGEGPEIVQEAQQTLHNFCKWQWEMRARPEWTERPYDAAVLLTRQNLCQQNFCETLGLAHIGTVCEKDENCAVIQDIGLQSAFNIAHELGHLLGMAHDNSEICAQMGEFPRGNQMMSAMLTKIDYSEPWSRCSTRLSLGFFESGRADCLLNQPRVSLAEMVPLPGRSYDRDHQCRLTFGPGHRARPDTDPCPVLWCMARRLGQWHHSTKYMPAADGTECERGRVCMRGKCVLNWQQAKPVDGNWGPWGPWWRCSRTCGGGVQYSRRRCDNPLPADFGRYCHGKRDIFQSCNLAPCPENNGLTFRDEQCAARNGLNGEGRYQEWEPYYHGIRVTDLCKLNCLLTESSQVTVFAIKVKDGTRCSPHSDAVCVRSRCMKTGCDGVIGSRKRYSKCGVCDGEDAECKRVVRRFRNNITNYGDVATIPLGAANFKARQVTRRGQGLFTAYLALKRADGTYALNGGAQISAFESLLSVGGVAFRYPGWSPRRDVLEAVTQGQLLEPLVLQVYNPGRRRAVRVAYSYYVQRAGLRNDQAMPPPLTAQHGTPATPAPSQAPTARWCPGPWQACSVSCGVGWQVRSVRCCAGPGGESGVCDDRAKEAAVALCVMGPC